MEAPTDEGGWFTPRTGWPEGDYAGGRPTNLMPTEGAMPGFHLPDADALGELRVELLETDGLPTMDLLLDENDVYALFLFEGTVACTQAIMDVNNPRWHCVCARALRLPVHTANSALHVACFRPAA